MSFEKSEKAEEAGVYLLALKEVMQEIKDYVYNNKGQYSKLQHVKDILQTQNDSNKESIISMMKIKILTDSTMDEFVTEYLKECSSLCIKEQCTNTIRNFMCEK